MGIRRNILALSAAEVRRLTNALNTLKRNGVYDAFVERHMRAMMEQTPPNDPSTDRNVAHRGPAFLPWHRASLVELADALRRVDPAIDDFPYWDWVADQELPRGPRSSRLWTDEVMGPDGDPNQNDRVLSGPFADWRAVQYVARTDSFRLRASTGLRRQLGRTQFTTLPTRAQVNDLLQNYPNYDVSPWDESRNTRSFRNRLEGWLGGNILHNRCHRWIGGDMIAGTSPNDPVFWLHHCNVDRIWAQWQERYGVNNYAPRSGGPRGHNLNDTMSHLINPRSVASVLNISNLGYRYE